jgi:hypothetical protein
MSDASIRELRRERERRQKPPIPRRYRGPLSRLFAGRPHTVVLRSLFALKTSAWYIVISGFSNRCSICSLSASAWVSW